MSVDSALELLQAGATEIEEESEVIIRNETNLITINNSFQIIK